MYSVEDFVSLRKEKPILILTVVTECSCLTQCRFVRTICADALLFLILGNVKLSFKCREMAWCM